MPHDVFICHSSQDKGIADGVCAGLESAGLRCWIAPRDITPGLQWDEAIVEAIESSKVVVLIFSHHSNGSNQVNQEVRTAVASGATVIPFRLEDLPLSKALKYHLAGSHWLDAVTPPIQRHIAKLAETIRRLLAPSATATTDIRAEPAAAPKVAAPRGAQPANEQAAKPARRPLVASWVVVVPGLIILAVLVLAIRGDPTRLLRNIGSTDQARVPAPGFPDDSILLTDPSVNPIVVPGPVGGHPARADSPLAGLSAEHMNPPGSAVAVIHQKITIARVQMNRGDFAAAREIAEEAVQDAKALAKRYPNSDLSPVVRAGETLQEVRTACERARSIASTRGTTPPSCN